MPCSEERQQLLGSSWQRDPIPMRICRCGHPDGSHDLKEADRRGPCRAVLTGCTCRGLDPAELVWTERRSVTERVDRKAALDALANESQEWGTYGGGAA